MDQAERIITIVEEGVEEPVHLIGSSPRLSLDVPLLQNGRKEDAQMVDYRSPSEFNSRSLLRRRRRGRSTLIVLALLAAATAILVTTSRTLVAKGGKVHPVTADVRQVVEATLWDARLNRCGNMRRASFGCANNTTCNF